MGTTSEFVNATYKRLISSEDFGDKLVAFMMDYVRELAMRVFDADGVFDEKITLEGDTPDVVVLKQVLDAFTGTDGLGNVLSLGATGSEDEKDGQVKSFPIENTLGTTYYVSLQYSERPSDVAVNPRTGLPEFTGIVQAIGAKAAPNSVVDNVGTLTFVVDSVCEVGHSHAGREVMVWKLVPDRNGITAAIAFEFCTVSWNGVNNRITTVGTFGQTSPSTTAAHYAVTLLGPSVRKVSTVSTSGHLYIGSIVGVGAGNIPGAGDNTDQVLIDQSLSTLTAYPGTGNWADGTTNPATTVIAQLDKIVADLTSVAGQRGAGKLTAPARTSWVDATANPAARLDQALDKIVTDLISTVGNRGLGKITAPARANWADGSTNPAAAADAALAKIITDLTVAGGHGGADLITCRGMDHWADGTVIADGSIFSVIDAIISDLGVDEGTLKINGEPQNSGEIALASGTLKAQLLEILGHINNPLKLYLAAARNYDLDATVMNAGFTAHDIAFGKDAVFNIPRWYVVGDDEAGTPDEGRYSLERVGKWHDDGGAWGANTVEAVGIAYSPTAAKVFMVGSLSTGDGSIQHNNELMSAGWTEVGPAAIDDTTGKAAFFNPDSTNCFAGFSQNAPGTGSPIMRSADTVTWAAPGTIPAACRSIVSFSHAMNGATDIMIAVGEDAAGDGMILRMVADSNVWSDVTPAGGATPFTDVCWDSHREWFWAISGPAGDIYYSDDFGATWTAKTAGVFAASSCAADNNGIVVFVGGASCSRRVYATVDGRYCDSVSIPGMPSDALTTRAKVRYLGGRFVILCDESMMVGWSAIDGTAEVEHVDLGA